MDKKLEAGCKAVVVGTMYNNGLVVNVGHKFICTDLDCALKFEMVVSVEPPLKYINALGEQSLYGYTREENLRRIDDDQNQIVSWESMKDIWVPSELIGA